jgi:spectinomycin phosphotransferase
VYSEPRDLDRAVLADALKRHWRIGDARLDYLPIGFGSHHWQAIGADRSRWFVSADDLRAGHHAGRAPDDVFVVLDRAFRTAAALRDEAGLEFVLAPIPSDGGTVLRRIDTRYAIRVEPFVDGAAGEFGEFEQPEERRRMGTLLGRLHAASGSVPPGLPGREDFALPGREALEEAFAQLDTPRHHGPFAEPARQLLRAHASEVRDRLRRYDQLAARVRNDPGTWVVTHGEPHSANVIRDAKGGLQLVDWDTALIGPRERDLWMTLEADLTGWDEYREVIGSVRLNEQALSLYRERWALAEICIYTAEFRRPHEETEDTRASWDNLGEYLKEEHMSTSDSTETQSASEQIDKRIAGLEDWRGETLSRMRKLIQEADPEVVEEWKWAKQTSPGTPVWSHDGIICTGESYKSVVKLTFMKGASLSDPAKLFNSSLEGNARRAIDIHEGEEVDADAFKTLIRAAVSLNTSG